MDASHDNYKRESYGSKNESIRSECESDEPLENSGSYLLWYQYSRSADFLV